MFIIKALGIVLTVVSGAMIGFLKSRSLIDRHKKLALLLDGTNIFLNFVEQSEYELEFAVKNAFCKCEFLEFKDNKFLCCDTNLKSDKFFIEEFFACLGCSTKKVECERINHFKTKLKSHIDEAKSNAMQKSQVYQTLGICAGLAIGILLI